MGKKTMENKKEKRKPGFAVNKNAFYKKVVQYECRWRKN